MAAVTSGRSSLSLAVKSANTYHLYLRTCMYEALHVSIHACHILKAIFLTFICLYSVQQKRADSADGKLVMFFFSYFSQKTGFDSSCKLSPLHGMSSKIRKYLKCCLLKFVPKVQCVQ